MSEEYAYPHDLNSLQFNTAGMTLRDWFAGQADVAGIDFPGLEAAAEWLGINPPGSSFIEQLEFAFKLEAKIRYMKANAMMEARKK